MDDSIAVVHDHPAVTGKALLLSLFIMLGFYVINNGIGKRIDHAVTGAGTDNKIVGKRDNAFQINQDNIFTLFVFKGIYNFASKFKCVQFSPHDLDNGAENNFVYMDPPGCRSLLKRWMESTLAILILPS